MAEERKPLWKSKKFWGIVLSVLCRLFGHRLGVDPGVAETAGNTLVFGVAAEAVIDAADAIGRGLAKRGEISPPREE
jgi:hypothetical protein